MDINNVETKPQDQEQESQTQSIDKVCNTLENAAISENANPSPRRAPDVSSQPQARQASSCSLNGSSKEAKNTEEKEKDESGDNQDQGQDSFPANLSYGLHVLANRTFTYNVAAKNDPFKVRALSIKGISPKISPLVAEASADNDDNEVFVEKFKVPVKYTEDPFMLISQHLQETEVSLNTAGEKALANTIRAVDTKRFEAVENENQGITHTSPDDDHCDAEIDRIVSLGFLPQEAYLCPSVFCFEKFL